MAKLKEIAEFLDKELNTYSIEDSSNNGVQVETRKEINKIGFAVDGCLEVFEKAKEENCDLVIVHHGISWNDNLKRITNNNYDRINHLIKNNIGLYASHLPLDMHKKYGNNIGIAKLLGLKKIKGFGKYSDSLIGYGGILPKPVSFDELLVFLEDKLGTLKGLNFGAEKIKKVSVISGRASKLLIDSAKEGYDCLITGEILHETYHDAKEYKTNVISCGHYSTEVFGVKALMPVLEKKFKVKTTFLDVPTGF